MTRRLSRSADETFAYGRSFAAGLNPGDVVAVIGTLGSGKTRFIAGVCAGLGVDAQVTSPTFTLINEYPAPFGLVAHADMYRIKSLKEVAELGLEEYFHAGCICMIEWADLIINILPPEYYRVELSHGAKSEEREIVIERQRSVAV